VLSSVKRIEYKARDGVKIEAYLTLPKGGKEKNLPTLMFPHGGPIARDSKAFDYWAQFFANRGYAVLQMNFRGSAGQGLEFRNSGLKKWGKEMQDDIEDGALELVKRGITDPNKICIVGASYGGYAALMGVVKTPDRYKCAISVNGVSNVFDLVKDNRAFWRTYNVVDEQIGNDNKTLREISPVNYAKKIKAPVLLIHGELDRQVEIKHSYQMRDAMEKAGKNVQFIEQAGEDHYLSNEAMRVQTFKAMDDFLAEYLPVK
jgi:dipeptidyl aminopeptidase/acylaminoacyl peptidase